jgi:hypothetical protein
MAHLLIVPTLFSAVELFLDFIDLPSFPSSTLLLNLWDEITSLLTLRFDIFSIGFLFLERRLCLSTILKDLSILPRLMNALFSVGDSASLLLWYLLRF